MTGLASLAATRISSLAKKPASGTTPAIAIEPMRKVLLVIGSLSPARPARHLLVVRRVDHGAAAEEEQRLEEGVGEQVQHRRADAVLAEAQRHHHQAQASSGLSRRRRA